MTPSAAEFQKAAVRNAQYFGFKHLDEVRAHPNCTNATDKKVEHKADAANRRYDALHGMLTAGMCEYFDNRLNAIEGPVLFYTFRPVPRTGETALALHVIGVEKSIAEALLIQTTRSLLEDLKLQNNVVRVNSLGDQESSARYIRELTNFMRKRIDDFPAPARELMKEHVFNALMYLVEKEHELAERSPSPLEYLSDKSRRHFREIIEFLDMSGIPYEIDPRLLGSNQCYSEAIFSITLQDEDMHPLTQQPLLVRGGRYDTFVSRMTRHPVPASGAVVVLRDKKAPARMPRRTHGKTPSVFVVQLGFGPKVRSLLLVNELKQAGIPVLQNIISDSLSEQLRKAEELKVRYAVILGQKEFVEGSVILRNLEARSQESIPTNMLSSHLRRVLR